MKHRFFKIKREKKKQKKQKNPIGERILQFAPLRKMLFREKNSTRMVKAVNPREDQEEGLVKLWSKRVGVVCVLLAAAVLMGVICYTQEPEDGYLVGDRELRRPDDAEEISLMVSGETDGETWEKPMEWEVGSREFTEEECKKIGEKIQSYAGEKLRGKNQSTEHVTERLVFAESVPGIPATLSWTSEEKYVRSDGTIARSKIPKEGMETEVMLEAKWKNYKGVYHYPTHLEPPSYTPVQLAVKMAKKEVKKAEKQQATSETIHLPDAYSYREEEESKNYLPVVVIILILLALPFLWREQTKRALAAREEQLLLDHPGFVNKVMLLLGAGLTVRFAMERMTKEYERERGSGGRKHYVYEELCITVEEMKNGVSETQAIEDFGKRCHSMPYMRFSSVIAQNLRKGADGVLAILEKEASDSLIERKQMALRMGEVAGTKLLFPMMVMLGLVMGIIMVPAFMSM